MNFLDRLAGYFYAASLVTLPWAGLGVLRLATGRDWGGGLQPSWLFMALAVAVAAVRWLVRGRPRTAGCRPGAVTGAGMIWVVAVVVSVLGLTLAPASVPWQEALARFLKQVVQLAVMLVFTVWVAWWTRDPRRWVWTARLIVAGALLQAGYGILQLAGYAGHLAWFGGLDRIFTSNPSILSGSRELYIDNLMLPVARLRGTVCEPLYLGNFLLLAIPLVVLTRWRRWWTVASGSLLAVLLVLTWSRGAWLAGAGGLSAFVILWVACGPKSDEAGFRNFRGWAGAMTGVALSVVLVLILVGDPGLLWRRLWQSFSVRDWSNLTRFYSMQAAWRAFLLSPVVGIGWGQFGWHFPALVEPLGLQSQFSWPVVNNFYLEVMCETGLLGLAGLVMFLVRAGRAFLARAVATCRRSDRDRVHAAAVAAAFTGVWLQMLTFSQYNLPHIWVALGLLIAYGREPGVIREKDWEADRS